MDDAIDELDMLVEWRKVTGFAGVPGGEDHIPEPKRGLDDTFDQANDRVNAVKAELNE